MATGTYGFVRPADINPEDVEIFYHYTPSRGEVGNQSLLKLSSDNLIKNDNPNRTQGGFELFGGLYTLRLPSTQFGSKGIYTIYIKPVEIRTKIIDVGVLSSRPDTYGLVFDLSSVPAQLVSRFENNSLVGYRVEYLNQGAQDAKINNLFRIVTSNNRAEPVTQNLTNTNQKAIRYRFNDNSNLVFCTVSPSATLGVKPNSVLYIGQPNQNVIITNTFFNPVTIEVEMVEYDIETLAVGMFGNKTRSIEDGIDTLYNFDNEIYKQWDVYEIRDQFNGKPLYEVKEGRQDIDPNKDFDTVSNP